MIETEKTSINVGHDLAQRVDPSTDQGHALRGILGVHKVTFHIILFCFALLFSNTYLPFGIQYLSTYSKRISGFDMAPPASALLPSAAAAAAAAATGTCTLLYNLKCHILLTVIFVFV